MAGVTTHRVEMIRSDVDGLVAAFGASAQATRHPSGATSLTARVGGARLLAWLQPMADGYTEVSLTLSSPVPRAIGFPIKPLLARRLRAMTEKLAAGGPLLDEVGTLVPCRPRSRRLPAGAGG